MRWGNARALASSQRHAVPPNRAHQDDAPRQAQGKQMGEWLGEMRSENILIVFYFTLGITLVNQKDIRNFSNAGFIILNCPDICPQLTLCCLFRNV